MLINEVWGPHMGLLAKIFSLNIDIHVWTKRRKFKDNVSMSELNKKNHQQDVCICLRFFSQKPKFETKHVPQSRQLKRTLRELHNINFYIPNSSSLPRLFCRFDFIFSWSFLAFCHSSPMEACSVNKLYYTVQT